MQIPLIPRRGQRKPWASIPRIDPGHPLARGLVFYGYDTGGGLVVDLISGAKPTLLNSPSPPQNISNFGSGRKYVKGGGSLLYPILPSVNSIFTSQFYSMACAYYLTVLPLVSDTAKPFAIGAAAGATSAQFIMGDIATNDIQWQINGAATPAFSSNTINAFHSLVGATTATNAQTVYFDGAVGVTATDTSSMTTTTNQAMFNSGDTAANSGNTVTGWVYYGAIWNRTVTAAEAKLLHNDPYCFLIYPEDEIFASLTGATTTPPGPGPNFKTSLLPMMGVG